MAFIQQTDAGGHSIRLLKINNSLYPPFSPDVINGVKDLSMREDDTIVCAYPKAGTHWVWEIIRCLQAETTTVPVVEKDNCMLEWMPAEYLDNLPSPRVFNTHLNYDQLPREVYEKRCQIIYVNRNPKDVAVSCYHHHIKLSEFYQYKGSWEDFLPLFLDGQLDYGSWFDYVQGWERVTADKGSVPIHVTHYEDLKKSPVDQIMKLAKFLGKDVESDLAAKVADKCSFSKMKSRKGQLETCSQGEPIMYRKGEVGDWVNWFTVAQNSMFDGYYRQLMVSSSLRFNYRADLGTRVTSRPSGVIIDSNMNVKQ